uniref:Uncharacterized protein n=1 Tax=Odontella aurita TaxID=265563 RepID=A0A7S4JGD0_9STRA|mmetsp:Transcript_46092/g.139836  ORF Transcript_46092/g.139836 Transcript_46092/m.139836 type:complete len:148 (+) Transcript_46092:109-552(+)
MKFFFSSFLSAALASSPSHTAAFVGPSPPFMAKIKPLTSSDLSVHSVFDASDMITRFASEDLCRMEQDLINLQKGLLQHEAKLDGLTSGGADLDRHAVKCTRTLHGELQALVMKMKSLSDLNDKMISELIGEKNSVWYEDYIQLYHW